MEYGIPAIEGEYDKDYANVPIEDII